MKSQLSTSVSNTTDSWNTETLLGLSQSLEMAYGAGVAESTTKTQGWTPNKLLKLAAARAGLSV